ncbi:MAG: hypothetical protein ACHQE5_03155, partial [Actinomycetes bacterium]
MTDGDVPDDDMNENLFPFQRRDGGLPSDDVEKLLRGQSPAAGSTPEAHAVADVLAALCQPAQRGELAGEKAAVAAFVAAKEEALAPDETRRRSVLSALTGAKLAVAAVAGSLALGGVAAAACTGTLPGPFQDVAHTLGAPGAEPDGVAGSADPIGSGTPTASAAATASGSHQPGADHPPGHGPSAFAICWFVVQKAGGAAGGPWADHTDGGTVTPDDGNGDGRDDHGRGEWSAAFAKLQATAAASGQTVLDYCTTLLATHTAKPHPTKHADKHGKNDQGSHDAQGSSGRGHSSN